jgi:hypothetical protein
MLGSDWYASRLTAKQNLDIHLWDRHVRALKAFLSKDNYAEEATRLGVSARLAFAQKTSEAVRSTDYVQRLRGTTGAQPW